jgi:hypothetical protein
MNYDQPEVTPDLRNLILNFVGQTYGEMHKLDKDIVQTASHLQPASELLKVKASNIINSITPQRPQQQFNQPVFTGSPVPQTEFVSNTPQYDPNQLEFNLNMPTASSSMLDVLKSIESKLQYIATNLDVIVDKLSN